MQSLKVERPDKTLRTLALDRMRDAILDSHFKPGERLIERDLCTQLGVSRTIVREVLRHLESEGLVATSGLRGPVVATTTTDQAMQIYEIRGALEGMAAKACAERGGEAAAQALQGALDRIRKAYAARKLDRVLAETSEFYRLLFAGAGQEIAWSIVSSLTARITRLRAMTIKTPHRDVEGPRQMQQIVDAIRNGDGEAAAQAAEAHVARASQLARAALQAETEPN
ncbi:MAG: GntR family transcriptional regulator [Rhizobiaceae bacterium]|nr:GntR family transcriptional regulator [Rhizobiaceae bacterium]